MRGVFTRQSHNLNAASDVLPAVFASAVLEFHVDLKLRAFSSSAISCDTPRGLSELAAFRIKRRRRQRSFDREAELH